MKPMLLALLLPAAAMSTEPRDASILAAIAAEDPAALATLAGVMAAQCDATEDASSCYLAGYANYSLARRSLGSTETAAPALVACGTSLERAQRDPQWKAEADALLTGCWGFAISMNPMKGMALGPRSAALAEAALAMAPDSPRVVFLAASRLYYTPAAFGGDKRRAAELVARGLDLATQEEAAPSAIGLSWARSELEYLRQQLTPR
jgi:hypothetical protein